MQKDSLITSAIITMQLPPHPLESGRKFKSGVGAIMNIQQPLSRDAHPITLPLLKTLLQFLDPEARPVRNVVPQA